MELRRPEWLKTRYAKDSNIEEVMELLEKNSINTVCREANCPNFIDCFSRKTATFMILGKNCTRNCRFCNVTNDKPEGIDDHEPERIADAVIKMNLNYVVITSVTRDDLDDGGAEHYANVVRRLKGLRKNITVELLIPDLNGDVDDLRKILESGPDVLGHNMETTERLYPEVRPAARYGRSLEVIRNVKKINKRITSKSGIMLGLGETDFEVRKVMCDLRKNDCDIMTIGQYLAPSDEHYTMKEYVKPEVFDGYARFGKQIGFRNIFSAPLVRSSFHADDVFEENCKGL